MALAKTDTVRADRCSSGHQQVESAEPVEINETQGLTEAIHAIQCRCPTITFGRDERGVDIEEIARDPIRGHDELLAIFHSETTLYFQIVIGGNEHQVAGLPCR